MQQSGRDWLDSGHRAEIVARSKMTLPGHWTQPLLAVPRPSTSGGELEDFLHLQEAGLISNPQGASLTLGADLQGLQVPCVTLPELPRRV
jgi:hypothetical protein